MATRLEMHYISRHCAALESVSWWLYGAPVLAGVVARRLAGGWRYL